MKPYPPTGFCEAPQGSLACPHRDVSCCPECAAKHEEILVIGGQHFWISDPVEREEIAKIQRKTS